MNILGVGISAINLQQAVEEIDRWASVKRLEAEDAATEARDSLSPLTAQEVGMALA